MAYDKKTFLKSVTIICDTREQKNEHILKEFNRMNVNYITDKSLPFGDYSFIVQDRDFSLSCVIERKANVNEFYSNITSDRGRIEKEFSAASALSKEFILIIENCGSEQELEAYEVPDWEMKRFNRTVKDIGKYCYATIQSWKRSNKYNFSETYVKDNSQTAIKILEAFYWYWRNFKILTASRRNRKG